MTRPLIRLMFAVVVAMALLLLAIALAEPAANSAGLAHPLFPGMQSGGDGAARLEHIGTFAFLFKSLLLLFIACLAVLGVSERHRTGELLAYITATFLFMLFIWWQMYSSHQHFLETGETGYFLGFPIATAWQMYGTWLGAIPLVLVYCLGFRKFILTDDEEARFNALLNQQNDTDIPK